MANFAAYQSRGQLAAPEVHFTKPVGVSYDNPGERALARVNADTAGVIVKGYENWKEQYDSGKVMEANNEYNRLMSEGTAKLMQKKQENALNIVQDYDKLHQKALDQVRKKFGAFINYGKPGQAFNIYTERDNNTRRNRMMAYQMDETEKFHETQYQNQLVACEQFVSSGGYTDEAIDAGVNRAIPLVMNRHANSGNEVIQQQIRAVKGQMVESALSYAVAMNDYARMKDICTKYRDVINPGKMSNTLALVGKRQKEAKDLAFNQQMLADLGANATPEQIDAYVENKYAQRKKVAQGSGRLNNVPLMKQWDENWEDIPFSHGTLGTSGCAPTSMAMELSWLIGRYVSPVEVADYATNNGLVASDGVHGADFVPAVAAHYGVDMRKTEDKEEVIELLRKGIPVVAAHDRGMFTNNGHFLVYAGIDAEGRVLINDPNGGVRHSDDATFSLDEIFNQESADYYVPDSVPDIQRSDSNYVYDDSFDELELEERKKEARKFMTEQQSLIKTTNNLLITQGSNRMADLRNQGVMDEAQYQAIVDEYAFQNGVVNNDVRISLETNMRQTLSILEKEAAREAKQASGTGGSGDGKKNSDPFFQSMLETLLRSGASREQCLRLIDEQNPTGGKDLINFVDKYFAEEGKFSEKWGDYKTEVASACGLSTNDPSFDFLYSQATNYAYELIMQYRDEHGGREPTAEQKKDYIIDGMTKNQVDTGERGWLGGAVYKESPLTRGQWFARGVYNDPAADYDSNRGLYYIQTRKGMFTATEEQYQRIVAGEDADVVLS